jgi:hypothetical protein
MALSDEEWMKLWNEAGGSPATMARNTGMSERAIHARKVRMASRGFKLPSPTVGTPRIRIPQDKYRISVEVENATIVVGSDAHYWPGSVPAAHKAFVAVIAALKPEFVVLNGDLFDGARISRHDRIGWDKRPTVQEELEAVKDRLWEIEKAAVGANLFRTMGNHDLRFETRLASHTPEFEGVHGFRLDDHLPRWQSSVSIMVNGDCQIKHRWHNGVHATYNNTLKSGVSIVTGHLHSLRVTPWTDLKGTRYGVDTGTLSDPDGPQFDYTEDSAKNWRPGFVVLTWYQGELLPPEVCQVLDEDRAVFRGQVFDLERSDTFSDRLSSKQAVSDGF